MNASYNDAVNLLTSKGKFYINLGLERVSTVLELLGNPQDNLKYIHVAGTNGKGSVCSIIASILREKGLKTGVYTSPHIYEYTERIKIFSKIEGDREISKDDFTRLIFEISDIADKNNIHLTEFEILTVVMFKYFEMNEVDVVVLETGLGGRFDATNVIKENLCSVITHIDLDHTERLGATKSEIAREKAGIIKKNCPVITMEGYEAIKDKADEMNSLLLMVSTYEDIKDLSLKGVFQRENLTLALTAVRFLYPDTDEETIFQGLKNTKHIGRFQEVEKNHLIVDGAHNPNGARALRESLDFYYPKSDRAFVFGCLRNKDYEKMMEILFRKEDTIYFNHFSHQNSATVEELQAGCKFKAKKFTSLEDIPQDKLIIVCGSLYMISEVISRLT